MRHIDGHAVAFDPRVTDCCPSSTIRRDAMDNSSVGDRNVRQTKPGTKQLALDTGSIGRKQYVKRVLITLPELFGCLRFGTWDRRRRHCRWMAVAGQSGKDANKRAPVQHSASTPTDHIADLRQEKCHRKVNRR